MKFTDGFEVFQVITVISVLMLACYRTSVGKQYENSTAKLWREKGLHGTGSCLWFKIKSQLLLVFLLGYLFHRTRIQ